MSNWLVVVLTLIAALPLAANLHHPSVQTWTTAGLQGPVKRVTEIARINLADITTIIDEYDRNGRLHSKTILKNGKPDDCTLYRYDQRGNLVEETSSITNRSKMRIVYRYGPRANLQETLVYTGPGALYMRTVYLYSKAGQLLADKVYNREGEQLSSSMYQYDPSGRLLVWLQLGDSGLLPRETRFVRNAAGYPVRVEERDEKGALVSSKRYRYDARGNLLEEVWSWPQEGNRTDRTVYAYDAHDRKIKESRYGANNQLKAVLVWVYTSAGRLATQQDRISTDDLPLYYIIDWHFFHDARGNRVRRQVTSISPDDRDFDGPLLTTWEYEYY